MANYSKTKRIHRAPHDKDHPYVQISKQPLEDAQLSWAAKGLLCYLLSKSNHWRVRTKDELHHHATNGYESTNSALKELKAKGYVQRVQLRGPDGKIVGNELHITETPVTQPLDKPAAGKPSRWANQRLDFASLPNTDLPNTDLPNTHSPKKEVGENNKNLEEEKPIAKVIKLPRGGF